ncbi:3-dehydroquinate synthase [soil metagenome]
MNNFSEPIQYTFSGTSVQCYFGADFADVYSIHPGQRIICITDRHVYAAHRKKFDKENTIIIEAGEKYKTQDTVNKVIRQLIELKADRQAFIIGVGGGVVTDIAGFAASVYMRGLKFAFVPTTILGMVDACMGGKNGINAGIYKNLVGVIRHPEFLLYDYSFLDTLPSSEWINGFAEIIKHACIRDEEMFSFLESHKIKDFRSSKELTADIVRKNVDLKYEVVSKDEFETGERKLLNFGHTIGHAIENTAKIPHGQAISIGMVLAAGISTLTVMLPESEADRITALLKKYRLPVRLKFNKQKAWTTLQHDKKMAGDSIHLILLTAIGKGVVHTIHLHKLHSIYKSISL